MAGAEVLTSMYSCCSNLLLPYVQQAIWLGPANFGARFYFPPFTDPKPHPSSKDVRLRSFYFAGRYLELRGQKEEAKGFYARCIKGYNNENYWLPVLAGAHL